MRYKDKVKQDMKDLDMDAQNWEALTTDRPNWKITLTQHLKSGEARLRETAAVKRARRKAQNKNPASVHVCDNCRRDCQSRIGLFSHRRRCTGQPQHQGHYP